MAASIASYTLFLLLPLLWELKPLAEEIPYIISIMISVISVSIISNALMRDPKPSLAPPIIGGLMALLTSQLLFGRPPGSPPQAMAYVYYSASAFASGAIASTLGILRRRKAPHEVVEEVRREEAAEEIMLRCPHCESEIPADSIFCPLCGGKIGEGVET